MKRLTIKAFIPNISGIPQCTVGVEKNGARHAWFRLSSKELESTKKDYSYRNNYRKDIGIISQ